MTNDYEANLVPPITGDKDMDYFLTRKRQLEEHRKNAHGVNLEDMMRYADRDYELKPLNRNKDKTRGLNIRVSENIINLRGEDEWQSDNNDAIMYSKVQTALALLFDRNPEAILTPKSKKFVATTELAKAIFENSQYKETFKDKLKVFVFNMAKYGWAFGRTAIREVEREYEDLVEINPITLEKKYEKKTEVDRRVYFHPLSNWNVWVDDRARPYQPETVHDWMYREIYTDEDLKAEFGDTKEVRDSIEKRKGIVLDKRNTDGSGEPRLYETSTRRDLNEVFFYESHEKDMVFVVSNGKKIYKGKLPTHKELSLINVFWNMRNDLSIYGCGICEIMRQDKNLLDKIRNMSVDQLVLSIYKMFFYDGTLNSEDAQIKLKPGRGIRVLDPSKVKWLEVPSGGAEAYSREALLRENIEESTGISKALTGVLNSDPNVKALALQQAKESALAKLRSPLDNILSALAREARIRWSLIQELNMFPEEVHKLYDPEEISAYLEEINHNAELFYHDPTEGAVYALKYPEIAANLTVDKNGVYKASQERAFFNVTPDMIRWDGEITFSAEAILVVNKELQKQMDLDMANLLIPLFSGDPNLLLKPAKQILKIYGKDEADWLPDAWLHPSQFAPQAQPIGPGGMGPQSEVQPTDQGQNPQTQPNQVPGLPRVVSERETQPGSGTTDIVNKMVARTQNPAI